MTDDFFQSRLDAMIDLRHPLAVLATRMPWPQIEASFAPLFAHRDRAGRATEDVDLFGAAPKLAGAGISAAGRPRLPIRLMAGLLYLKHAYNLSDEAVCERWAENNYWQYFCGEDYFQPHLPGDPTNLGRFRSAIGEAGVEELLATTIAVAANMNMWSRPTSSSGSLSTRRYRRRRSRSRPTAGCWRSRGRSSLCSPSAPGSHSSRRTSARANDCAAAPAATHSRIELARAVRPFVDVADLARRAQLDRHDLQVLARANALRARAGGNRRAALWLAAAAVPDRDLLRGTERDDAAPALPQASEGNEIVTDYRAMGFTLGRHPLALLRDRLALDRMQPADQLETLRSGQLARACGLVTVRQRPGTANGVLFMTLEDETGQVNVILWPGLLEKFRKEALGAQLFAVYGVWQVEGKVRHLIASKLVDRTELLGALPTTAREFC